MRKGIFLIGLILIALGAIFMVLSVLPKTVEFTNREDIFYKLHNYGSVGTHEYETRTYLVSGTYELKYHFYSDETTLDFYVRVLDPDSAVVKYDSGQKTETVYQGTSYTDQFTFEIQKIGEYTFQLGGRWTMFDVWLDRITRGTKTIYPYESAVYLGFLLLIGGAIISISGALMKEILQKQKTSITYTATA